MIKWEWFFAFFEASHADINLEKSSLPTSFLITEKGSIRENETVSSFV